MTADCCYDYASLGFVEDSLLLIATSYVFGPMPYSPSSALRKRELSGISDFLEALGHKALAQLSQQHLQHGTALGFSLDFALRSMGPCRMSVQHDPQAWPP